MDNCQLKPSAPFSLPVSVALSRFAAHNCYSHVVLNNFHDRGCGSRKPPLATLTLLSLRAISELPINMHEGIWIMRIGMTKYHFERGGRGNERRWRNLGHLRRGSPRGLSLRDKWDTSPAAEVRINNDITLLYSQRTNTICDVVITGIHWLYADDI